MKGTADEEATFAKYLGWRFTQRQWDRMPLKQRHEWSEWAREEYAKCQSLT